jgi:two-component sensor histidine kinase
MREADLFAATYVHVALNLLLPVLMLGLASLAIWIATDRQVTRWILYLRRISLAYARGHYAVRPGQLERAPSEFRMLGNTLANMAAALQDRDQRLRDALTQKTVLIRETHHRVKNNLQIVMSLLSLQAAHLRDPAAQEALNQAQMRVNALALVHRKLHEIEDQETVDLKQLLDDLAHQIRAGLGDERQTLVLNLDILSRRVVGDIAVPLSLFAVEAMTNAFKHAFTDSGAGGWIRISLVQASEEMLAFTIEDNGTGADGASSRGIGKRLMTAFARQVGGTLEVKPRTGGGTCVTLTFPDPRRNSPQSGSSVT